MISPLLKLQYSAWPSKDDTRRTCGRLELQQGRHEREFKDADWDQAVAPIPQQIRVVQASLLYQPQASDVRIMYSFRATAHEYLHNNARAVAAVAAAPMAAVHHHFCLD